MTQAWRFEIQTQEECFKSHSPQKMITRLSTCTRTRRRERYGQPMALEWEKLKKQKRPSPEFVRSVLICECLGASVVLRRHRLLNVTSIGPKKEPPPARYRCYALCR